MYGWCQDTHTHIQRTNKQTYTRSASLVNQPKFIQRKGKPYPNLWVGTGISNSYKYADILVKEDGCLGEEKGGQTRW